MLMLLPPSETKAPGGDGPPLRLDMLAHPELVPVRRKLIDELVGLAGQGAVGLAALGLSEHQYGELERNAALWTSPTLPALRRYTGVLYDALDVGSLRRAERARAGARLAVASALFGLLAADDAVPAYRLSASSSLPGLGTVRSAWRPVLPPVLARITGLVVDLRSGTYADLGPLPGAVTVRVLSADERGQRRTVSHHNKAHKGRVARLLATAPREVAGVEGVARVIRRGGLVVERTGERALDVVLSAGCGGKPVA
ncbi:MAG: peroxide stress protein YaaA [Pseudonocardiaceae bacterium]